MFLPRALRVMTTVSMRAMNVLPSSDWLTRLNFRQITAGPSLYSSALITAGTPSRRGNSHIAGSDLESVLPVRAVLAGELSSLGAGPYEVPSSGSVHDRWRIRNRRPYERLFQQALGCRCTPRPGHAARDCPPGQRCPQPHLTPCFILAICVALHEIRSVCMHDRHMLPTLMYIVHARILILPAFNQSVTTSSGGIDRPYG